MFYVSQTGACICLQDLADKEGVDIEVMMAKIRFWYDGFSWNAQGFVIALIIRANLFNSCPFKYKFNSNWWIMKLLIELFCLKNSSK
jgi:hypothetical protein